MNETEFDQLIATANAVATLTEAVSKLDRNRENMEQQAKMANLCHLVAQALYNATQRTVSVPFADGDVLARAATAGLPDPKFGYQP